jgi:hypothetical protein
VSADTGSDLEPVLRALEGLVASADPTVVFTSVARLCVPLLCDAATVTIRTADQQPYQTTWPEEAMVGEAITTSAAVLTPITGMNTEGGSDYHGVLALHFHTSSPSPGHGVLAQLVVDRAVAVIERARLADLVTAQQAQAEHLRIALTTNREIGIALGILMASRMLTSEGAFDYLRHISQHTHRKLHDLALELVETGTIELPTNVIPMPISADAPQRRSPGPGRAPRCRTRRGVDPPADRR